jgi:RNA polymerase sigma-70 factor (ECF subfamily)
MDEQQTILACLAGREEEYRLIVDAYKSQVMALALNVLGNREDAEDVCQDVFVQVYRHLRDYDPARSFRTWVFTILYRRCLDVLKKRRRFRLFFDRIAHEPGHPLASELKAPFSRLGHGETRALLEGLSPRERTALSLWANEGLTAAEIAEVMNCSPSTARVYLFHARRKVKAFLERKEHGTLGDR